LEATIPAWGESPRAIAAFGRSIVEQLTPDERALYSLRYVFELSVRDSAAVLGLSEDNASTSLSNARARIRNVWRQLLPGSMADVGDVTIAEKLTVSRLEADLENSFEHPSGAGGVSLNELISNPSAVRIVGLGKNVDTVAPLAAIFPPGMLGSGQSLKITEPIVLRAGQEVQPIAVTAAVPFATLADGRSIWLLRAYCLDKAAHAPLVNDEFGFEPSSQALLSPTIRGILSNGGANAQEAIWAALRPK
jgi:hypothetical protein